MTKYDIYIEDQKSQKSVRDKLNEFTKLTKKYKVFSHREVSAKILKFKTLVNELLKLLKKINELQLEMYESAGHYKFQKDALKRMKKSLNSIKSRIKENLGTERDKYKSRSETVKNWSLFGNKPVNETFSVGPNVIDIVLTKCKLVSGGVGQGEITVEKESYKGWWNKGTCDFYIENRHSKPYRNSKNKLEFEKSKKKDGKIEMEFKILNSEQIIRTQYQEYETLLAKRESGLIEIREICMFIEGWCEGGDAIVRTFFERLSIKTSEIFSNEIVEKAILFSSILQCILIIII